MSTDPERVRNSRMVENVFPRSRIVYRVCTERDLQQTLDHFFGAGGMGSESIGDLLGGLDSEEEVDPANADDVSAAADNELVKLVNKIIVDAYKQGASDIHIEPLPGKGKMGVRFRKDGSLSNYIEVPAAYRSALVDAPEDHVRPGHLGEAQAAGRQDQVQEVRARWTSSCAWRPSPPPAASRTW